MHTCCFWFSDKSQTIVIFVSEEASLNGSSTGGSLGGIVPDGGHSQVVPDVALFTVEDLSQRLL